LRLLVHGVDLVCEPGSHHCALAIRHLRRHCAFGRAGIHPGAARRNARRGLDRALALAEREPHKRRSVTNTRRAPSLAKPPAPTYVSAADGCESGFAAFGHPVAASTPFRERNG